MRKIAWSGVAVGFLLGFLAGSAVIHSLYAIPYAMAGDYWAWKDRAYLWKRGWLDGLKNAKEGRVKQLID